MNNTTEAELVSRQQLREESPWLLPFAGKGSGPVDKRRLQRICDAEQGREFAALRADDAAAVPVRDRNPTGLVTTAADGLLTVDRQGRTSITRPQAADR